MSNKEFEKRLEKVNKEYDALINHLLKEEKNPSFKLTIKKEKNERLLYLKRLAYLDLLKRMVPDRHVMLHANYDFINPLDEEVVIETAKKIEREIEEFKNKIYNYFC